MNGGRKKNSECKETKDLGACWNSSLYTEPSPLRHHIGTAVSSNQWSTGIWQSAMPLSPSLYQHEHSGGLSAHAGALDAWPQEHEVFPLRPGRARWKRGWGEGGRSMKMGWECTWRIL